MIFLSLEGEKELLLIIFFAEHFGMGCSIKALKQEREYLAKRVSSKLTEEERERLYIRWEIAAVGKQRRLQLVNKLWTDPHNMEHIQESAEIVSKLVGFCESGDHASKEILQLNFVSHSDRKPYYCSMVLMLPRRFFSLILSPTLTGSHIIVVWCSCYTSVV